MDKTRMRELREEVLAQVPGERDAMGGKGRDLGTRAHWCSDPRVEAKRMQGDFQEFG